MCIRDRYEDYLDTQLTSKKDALLRLYTNEAADLVTIMGEDDDSSAFCEEDLQQIVLHGSPADQQGVDRVLQAFVCRNHRIGFVAGIAKIVTVLVAFAAEESTAFWLLCVMIEDLRVSDFYERPPAPANGMLVEVDVLMSLTKLLFAKQCAGAPRWPVFDKDGLSVALDQSRTCLLGDLSLDMLPLDTMLDLWNEFFCSGSAAGDGGWCKGDVTSASNAVLQGILALVECRHEQIIALMKQSGKSGKPGTPDSQLLSNFNYPPAQALREAIRDVSPEELQAGLKAVRAKWNPAQVIEIRLQAKKKINMDWTKGTRLDSLVKTTHFSKEEMEKLARWFGQQPLEESGEGAGISKEEFMNVLGEMLPEMSPDLYGPLFEIADEDGSNDIDFKELAGILSVLSKGSFEEKVKLCFEMYDVDRSGFLDEGEIVQLATVLLRADITRIERELQRAQQAGSTADVHALQVELATARSKVGDLTAPEPDVLQALETLGSPRTTRNGTVETPLLENLDVRARNCSVYAQELIGKMDVNNDGMISFKEFLDGAMQDPHMLQCFGTDNNPKQRPNLSFAENTIQVQQDLKSPVSQPFVKDKEDCCRACVLQ
eukprot:TRINITY_DN9606_c0_g1_i6.p1 TRINITY_DN9606_c0_g1~~TRINITY_DN9606_c0_g1_i6.p1  ORF type:complete len:601 (-),score=161.29 TRINITY_DN9606_c0_g1_i6:49-1851(-)